MKKLRSIIFPLTVYLALPFTWLAASFSPAASTGAEPAWLAALTTNRAEFLLPLVFATVVMNAALIIVHHLRENQRLAAFRSLHLRPAASAPAQKTNQPAPRAPIATIATIATPISI